MRRLIIPIIALAIGCNTPEPKKNNTDEYPEIDSILTKSQHNTELASGASQKSDSLIGKKIDNTVKKITHLETEVKQLKAENNELKEKLDDADDAGKPFRIRSISNNQKD
jgi:seryl-tRNA synthetase